MKKCTYCGREYPDDAVTCSIDEQPLAGRGMVPPVLEELSPRALAAPPAPEFRQAALTDRQMEILELVLVCAIAFGVSIFASMYIFLGGSYHSPESYSWTAQALQEVFCLALVWYLLQRRGISFHDLGLIWSWKDIGWSVALVIAASAAFYAVYCFLYVGTHFSEIAAGRLNGSTERVGKLLFGGGFFLSTAVFVFINPFFEELIARAYLMTQVKRLTNSVTAAVLVSTILQMSYHFYQGGLAALSYGPTFLILSIYYAKTNRITPIILAHLYIDVGSTLMYWLRLG